MLMFPFQAESISFAVCQYFGIQTGENSFGYIASWSKGKELKELRASLETINKTSCELINDIERHYKEICKERGIDPVSYTHLDVYKRQPIYRTSPIWAFPSSCGTYACRIERFSRLSLRGFACT